MGHDGTYANPRVFNECPPKSHEITQVNKNSANYAMVAFSANHIKSPSATVNHVISCPRGDAGVVAGS